MIIWSPYSFTCWHYDMSTNCPKTPIFVIKISTSLYYIFCSLDVEIWKYSRAANYQVLKVTTLTLTPSYFADKCLSGPPNFVILLGAWQGNTSPKIIDFRGSNFFQICEYKGTRMIIISTVGYQNNDDDDWWCLSQEVYHGIKWRDERGVLADIGSLITGASGQN